MFGKTAFDALCSDIRSYRIAEAVAASAAVPLAFAPIVLETYPGGCTTQLPGWIERARHDPDAQPLLRSFAEANAHYHDGSMRYVKLLTAVSSTITACPGSASGCWRRNARSSR